MKKKKALQGIRVLDASTVIAGPTIGMLLGDFGADVIKIEHPRGDVLRETGHQKDGIGLWFKMANRNKRCITMNFSTDAGAELFKELIKSADVLIENFRTSTMERWGLGWETLKLINPSLVMVRVTGFGQTGPYKMRPGFGTIAEAFSGFAGMTGEIDGPPTLPNFGLADGIAASYGTFATMFALYYRDVQGGSGQFIDLSIYEPIFQLLGPQPLAYDQLGIIQERMGNRSLNNAPRNTYKTLDNHWVAVSTNSPSIVKRVLTLCGGEKVAKDPRFQTPKGRVEFIDEVDEVVSSWIGKRKLYEVLEKFEEVEAAVGPVYNIAQIFEDPQYIARDNIVNIDDEDLGQMKMTGAFPLMSETPAEVRHAGPSKGKHNKEIFCGELKLKLEELERLQKEGVV